MLQLEKIAPAETPKRRVLDSLQLWSCLARWQLARVAASHAGGRG
jgi:hypothetical protein